MPSTRSRNLRRRKKQQYERAAVYAPPGTSAANSVPLSSYHSSDLASNIIMASTNHLSNAPATHTGLSTDTIDMFSLSNKNKRRGFKRTLTDAVPQRIVFLDVPLPPLPSDTRPIAPYDAEHAGTYSRPSSPQKKPVRLVPPSEKQALGLLPSNMFVTSVDVESGLWPARRQGEHGKKVWDHKQKKHQRDAWGYDGGRHEITVDEEQNWNGSLPYDDPDTTKGEAGIGKVVDWDELERTFTSLPELTSEHLIAGSLVCWKELGIHPVRLTPEMVIHAARVTRADTTTQSFFTRSIARAMAVYGDTDGDGVEEEEDVEHAHSDLVELGWKFVRAGETLVQH